MPTINDQRPRNWPATALLLVGAVACLVGGYLSRLAPLVAVGTVLLAAAGLSAARHLWPLRDWD